MITKRLLSTSKQIDPICGMRVDTATSNFKTLYRGKTYYFCAASCRHTFETNPQKYLAETNSTRKGFWKRYLERLNKATGGKPPSCCQ